MTTGGTVVFTVVFTVCVGRVELVGAGALTGTTGGTMVFTVCVGRVELVGAGALPMSSGGAVDTSVPELVDAVVVSAGVVVVGGVVTLPISRGPSLAHEPSAASDATVTTKGAANDVLMRIGETLHAFAAHLFRGFQRIGPAENHRSTRFIHLPYRVDH